MTFDRSCFVRGLSLTAALSLLLAGCGGGGATVPATPATTAPTSGPSTNSTSSGAYTCPSSDSVTSVARSAAALSGDATRRAGVRPARSSPTVAGQLAVVYDRSAARSAESLVAMRERSAGGTLVQTLSFAGTNREVHVLSVPASQVASATAALERQTGVLSVGPPHDRRAGTVSQPYFPNDPYFRGFTAAQNTAAQNAAPGTFEVGPYEESGGVPGQWDMHAIGLGQAFAYSQPGNGSGIENAAALGSSSVKIAIIDTGEDPNHPELASKIVYQRCFITDASGTQSTSDFSMDPMGHGTDVAGIAAAATNNAVGFTGAGGNVVIDAYRVFPTPDDNCANADSSDAQCEVSTVDIASAIQDAIAQGVNVISMSLGGGQCGSGAGYFDLGDDDQAEGAAVQAALQANIVVVAAAGNSSGPPLNAPACDSGVIAVGATSLDDGTPDGSGHSGGSAANPVEYVASYTDYGSPGAALHQSGAWGIVAPGGDPTGNNDNDDLHWIENIWTTTPYRASASDDSFAGECTDDYPNSTLTNAPVDCRTLIAGTSMATPHVAGAAALILSVNRAYQSPAAMKQLLCSSADDIGDPNEGCGRLNLYRAMATAVGDANAPAGNGPW